MKPTDDAIYRILTGDAEIHSLVGTQIYREGSVPQTATFPRIHYGQFSGVPQYTYPYEAYKRTVQMIKGVDLGFSTAKVNAINDRVSELFNLGPMQTIDADPYVIKYSRRIRDLEMTERDGDKWYQHLGGEFEQLMELK